MMRHFRALWWWSTHKPHWGWRRVRSVPGETCRIVLRVAIGATAGDGLTEVGHPNSVFRLYVEKKMTNANNRNSRLALMAALALGVSSAAACGGAQNADEDGASTQPAAAEEADCSGEADCSAEADCPSEADCSGEAGSGEADCPSEADCDTECDRDAEEGDCGAEADCDGDCPSEGDCSGEADCEGDCPSEGDCSGEEGTL